jgi:hypothetical protein
VSACRVAAFGKEEEVRAGPGRKPMRKQLTVGQHSLTATLALAKQLPLYTVLFSRKRAVEGVCRNMAGRGGRASVRMAKFTFPVLD